ncbi:MULTISPECIES: DNA methyltransferase [Ligilactobacillus]|nr:DNA methyltransferase [Ligilactobacillus animalis]MDU3187450.1 DNA methyltransferase [Ligilactobacillus animalis]MEE0260607.1 DNA methyltransferase [Ligilactobacillus animalis]
MKAIHGGENEYLNWCYRWIDECFRVLKDNGILFNEFDPEHVLYIHYN